MLFFSLGDEEQHQQREIKQGLQKEEERQQIETRRGLAVCNRKALVLQISGDVLEAHFVRRCLPERSHKSFQLFLNAPLVELVVEKRRIEKPFFFTFPPSDRAHKKT